MLRSKSRSGFLEFGRKSQKSALSRTISASKFCRGDPLVSQIDAKALKPLDRNSSTGANSSEVVVQLTEELKMAKTLLEMAEQERDRARNDLQEMKIANEVAKQVDAPLDDDKDALIDGLELELSIFKASRALMSDSLSESKRRIKELETEMEKIRFCDKNKPFVKGIQTKIELDDLEIYDMSSLKSELKLALEAKEKNKRAVDDMVLKLGSKEMEVEKIKQEAEQNVKLLNNATRENEKYKNIVERLRLEADESLLAWNEREVGFVKCVKEAEDERCRFQNENIKLVESLKSANATIDTLREDNLKLKAILKQTMGTAKIENSLQIKNNHSENDEGQEFLARENRKLSVKEMNRPLIVASIKDPKTETKKQGAKTKCVKSLFEESKKGKIQKNRLSFDLSELKRNGLEDLKVSNEVPTKTELLTGSIFDAVDSPKLLTRRVSFSFANNKPEVKSDDFNRLEVSDFDDSGNSWIKKRRAFLQSFEDLIKGRSAEKEEKAAA